MNTFDFADDGSDEQHKKKIRLHNSHEDMSKNDEVDEDVCKIVILDDHNGNAENSVLSAMRIVSESSESSATKKTDEKEPYWCSHDRVRAMCKDCKGSQICAHDKYRRTCKDCGGSQICPHGKQRSICVDCGGSQICVHRKQKQDCRICGKCPHDQLKRNCPKCKKCAHGRAPGTCKLCEICEHDCKTYVCAECKKTLR